MFFKNSRIESLEDLGRDLKLLFLASVVFGIYETTVANFTFVSRLLHLKHDDFRDFIVGFFILFAFFSDEIIDILDFILCFGDRGQILLFGSNG